MHNLSPSDVSKWTSCPIGCDLSGFEIPTTETAPWGTPGKVVNLSLYVDHQYTEPFMKRTVASGVWNQDHHALIISMPTIKDPNREGLCSLLGLVRVSLNEGWQEKRNGFVVHGRALLEDEEKLKVLINEIAIGETYRLVAAYLSLRDGIAQAATLPPAP